MKKIILLSLLVWESVMVYAAWQAPLINYTPKEYGAGTQNWHILQHNNGWMYFGNNNGLLEFDGNTWNNYGLWNGSVVRAMAVGEDGRIYVGGSNEFGVFTANELGKLSYKRLSDSIPEKYRNFGEAWNILLLHNELYVQTHNYIFIMDEENHFSVVEPRSHIFCSAKIRNGIYLATTDGIYLLTGQNLNALRGSELLEKKGIRSMQPYGLSGMLIATEFNGLFLFNGEEIVAFPTEADEFIRKNELFSMATNEKHIAVGTIMDGIVILDSNGKNARYINNLNGLQNNTALTMEFDRAGSLWLGLDCGIDQIFLDSPVENLYGSINSKGAGYCTLIKGNTIYLGTNQGLFYDDYPIETSERLTNLKIIPESSGQVWHLDEIDSEIFCSHNRGLFTVHKSGLVPITRRDGFWQVRKFPGRDNLALAGSYNGFYTLKKENGAWKLGHYVHGFYSTPRLFEINDDGHVWVVTGNGVEELTFFADMDSCSCQVKVQANAQNDYFSVFKINDRIIISGNGHCQTVSPDGQLVKDEGFFEKMSGDILYSSIKTDENGNIWYICGNELKICPYDNKTSSFHKSIEVLNMPNFFIGGFYSVTPIEDGKAIVGNVSGFALADYHKIVNHSTQFDHATYLRRLYSTNSKDSLIFGDSYVRIATDLKIRYKMNSLRFEVSGSFDSNEQIEYCYRLEPLESEYSTWGSADSKEYTNLREGNYTFHVKSKSGISGKESENSFSFRILPPWYRSWWAYTILALLIILVFYMLYLYSRRKIELGKQRLAIQKDAEMRQKELQFIEDAHEKEKQILQLQNEHVQLELKSKSQELANVTLNRLNKNELLSDIKSDLKKIQLDLQNKNTDQALRKAVLLQTKLSNNIEQDVDWKKFEENFDIVHAHFIQELTKQYPWLNKKERKLCVYIRMGLLTKEIAPLMNMSTRGVEMQRYRMRKRMELDRTEDLEDYFQKFSSDIKEDMIPENPEQPESEDEVQE